MQTTTNPDGTVNAAHCTIISCITAARAWSRLLPTDECSYVNRSLTRSWLAGNVANIVIAIDTLAELLGEVPGAWDAREAVRRLSAKVVAVRS